MNPKQLVESLSPRERKAVLKVLGGEYEDKDELARLLDIAPAAGKVAVKESRTKPADADVLAELSPEQRKQAKAVKAAMAEKFDLPLSEFGAVLVEGGDSSEQKTVIMLTAGNGLYRGSWNTVMSDHQTEDFTIEVDGKQIDTRPAMTEAVYRSFIDAEKALGSDPLPDSSQLSNENGNGQPWTRTLLTGEQAGDFDAPVADVNDGDARRYRRGRGFASGSVRVRPAVVIE